MTDNNNVWTGVRLDPLDVLFFRDGRPFDAANRVTGGLPNPQTLAGALRTALLANCGEFDFAKFARERKKPQGIQDALKNAGAPDWILKAKFRGPWLYDGRKDLTPELVLPVPAVLSLSTEEDKQWFRRRPLHNNAISRWNKISDEVALPCPLWSEDGEREASAKAPGGFLTLSGIKKFLEGGKPDLEDHRKEEDLFGHDHRTGIVIDGETLTSVDGGIYGIQFLSLKKGVSIYAEICPGEGAPEKSKWLPELLPFGGEGRYVKTDFPKSEIDWPNSSSTNGKSLWLLATPAFVADGESWPESLTNANLQCAASEHPIAVSGWDVAKNGPLATRFAVPAGSTYFVEGDYTPTDNSLCTDGEQIAQGWGFALRGIWNDE